MADPKNKNLLGQTAYSLILQRLPTVEYFCQNIGLPSVSLGSVNVTTPVIDYPLPGEKLTFSPLNVTFRVDEDMKNFIEIFNWMVGLGSPEDPKQYRTYKENSINKRNLSDGTLKILSNKHNPNITVKFKEMFPENISELQFSTSASDIQYLEATASFRYTSYSISKT